MPDGTFASYQGFPLARCVFHRTRGWGADLSIVEIHVGGGIPADVIPPPPERLYLTVVRGQGKQPPPTPPQNLPAAAPDGTSQVRLPDGSKKLEACGSLLMLEVVRGELFGFVVPGLFVIRAETIRQSDDGRAQRVRLTLVDVRYFFVRGLLERWSFNRRGPDGKVRLDSVRPDRELFTRRELVAAAAAQLPSEPRVTAGPKKWDEDRGAVELPPFGSALHALQTLVEPAGLEEPALRLDGSLAFHAGGDGQVGYAKGGAGRNDTPIPSNLILSKDGAGQGAVVEPGFPEEFVVVVGGFTVATASLDDCEPVLILPGNEVRPLTEELVRRLTDGRYGMAWLMKFILRPTAYQNVPGVDPEVLDLFAEQAGRCFRIPGVEVRVPAPAERAGAGPTLLPGAADAQAQQLARDVNDARANRDALEPGPNAHLLPLLDRAETQAGRRLPVMVEAFGFTTVHQLLAATPSQEAYQVIVRELQKLYDTAPVVDANNTLFGRTSRPPLQVGDIFNGGKGSRAFADAKQRGVSFDDLAAAMNKARAIDRLADGGPLGKASYEAIKRLELQKAELEEKLGGDAGGRELLEAGFEIVALERELYEAAGPLAEGPFPWLTNETLGEFLDKRALDRDELEDKLARIFEKIDHDRDAARQRTQAGAAPTDEKPIGMVVLVNRDRRIDPDARVLEDLGVVKLSFLGVHVDPDRATDDSQATAVLKPVKATFGCVVRPRSDVPPGAAPRRTSVVRSSETPTITVGSTPGGQIVTNLVTPAQGQVADFQEGLGGESKIPGALSDEASVFKAAFKRTARGQVVQVPIDQVALDRAVSIVDRDLVELVPLNAPSNRDELVGIAQRKAQERTNIPDVVRSSRFVYARPWSVQCDGVVASVTIQMREKDGVPVGFETIVQTGSSAAALAPPSGSTVVRAPAVAGAGAAREGLLP